MVIFLKLHDLIFFTNPSRFLFHANSSNKDCCEYVTIFVLVCFLRSVFLTYFGTWLIEIQQSDWLVIVVKNSTDHTVENHVLNKKHYNIPRAFLPFRSPVPAMALKRIRTYCQLFPIVQAMHHQRTVHAMTSLCT